MAKNTATPEKTETGRGKLDEQQVRELFNDPKKFLNYLLRLPPHLLIHHLKVNPAKDNPEDVGGGLAAYWVALSWYLRDAFGFDRISDPDTVIGSVITHCYGPGNKETQPIPHGAGWPMAFWRTVPSKDYAAMRSAALAYDFKQFIEEGG